MGKMFLTNEPKTHNEGKKASSINGAGKIGKPLQKNETRLQFVPMYKS